jgi:hypothetical protein
LLLLLAFADALLAAGCWLLLMHCWLLLLCCFRFISPRRLRCAYLLAAATG